MFQLVTWQGGDEHVSPILMHGEEAFAHLDAERDMHRLAGWRIEDAPEDGERIAAGFNAFRGGTTRAVYLIRATPSARDRLRSWWLRRGV